MCICVYACACMRVCVLWWLHLIVLSSIDRCSKQFNTPSLYSYTPIIYLVTPTLYRRARLNNLISIRNFTPLLNNRIKGLNIRIYTRVYVYVCIYKHICIVLINYSLYEIYLVYNRNKRVIIQ